VAELDVVSSHCKAVADEVTTDAKDAKKAKMQTTARNVSVSALRNDIYF
jgi:hypothetical protein